MKFRDEQFTKEEIQRVTSLISLLVSVAPKEVSSANPAPRHLELIQGRGLIDKLELYPPESIDKDSLIEKCNNYGFKHHVEWRKERTPYLIINCNGFEIACRLTKDFYNNDDSLKNKEIIKKIIINPSHSSSFQNIELILSMLFGEDVFLSTIYRIDPAIDLYKNYNEVMRGLNVQFKQKRKEYFEVEENSVLAGKGLEKIHIYNKANQQKVDQPWTRIEWQISGAKAKALFKNLNDLRQNYHRLFEIKSLSYVSLNEITLNEPLINNEKFDAFKTFINHDGFLRTRKRLNNQNHFARDYAKFYSLTPHSTQLSEIFKRDITQFFQEVIQ